MDANLDGHDWKIIELQGIKKQLFCIFSFVELQGIKKQLFCIFSFVDTLLILNGCKLGWSWLKDNWITRY